MRHFRAIHLGSHRRRTGDATSRQHESAGTDAAGTLVYRQKGKSWEVLLVRPSGKAARWGWRIPMGMPEPGESLESAARRKTVEETGIVAETLVAFGFIDYQKDQKRVHCFIAKAPSESVPKVTLQTVAAVEFLASDEALRCINPELAPLIDRLVARLNESPSS